MRFALLISFLTLRAVGASQPLKLETLMSAPFASAPLPAPTGSRVAWLVNERGHRNVYVAGAPDWKGRAITSFSTDDGQEIADLAWSADGHTVLFARGGDFENGGENPNPNVSLTKPDQSIWSVNLDGGGAPRKLTEGREPAAAPKGDRVAFVRGGQVFLMKLDGTECVAAFVTKGSVSGLRWSPDGKWLAFTNVRSDHSFIGLYSTETKALEFPDASSGSDADAVWSPDGGALAYDRRPAEDRTFGPRRTGLPWSLRVYDVHHQSSREVFRADDGPGSVLHETASQHPILWLGDRIVFPWEKTGWLHLYSVPAAGGAPPVDLTPGPGEVEHVSAAADGKTIYYSTNVAPPDSLDVDRRHIWQVSATGSAPPTAVTSGEGIEWEPAPFVDSSALVYLASSFEERAHAMMRRADGQTVPLQSSAPEEAPRFGVKPQQVIVTAADGLAIHCQLFLPPHLESGARHPALVFVHGGSRRQMLLGHHYMYYYSNAYTLNEYLASLGYVVLSVNYRSGIGYGLNFREALQYGPSGGSEYQDVVGAGLYLKSRPDVDSDRIGIWGGSYGGYLTAMALARGSSLFAAGVDFHGVHDWSTIRNFEARGGDPATLDRAREALRVAFESSPMASVSTWRSPVLLIHGDDDRNVPFAQTVALAAALRERTVQVQELIFPNEIHDFLLHRHWLQAYEATADFFGKQFKLDTNVGSH